MTSSEDVMRVLAETSRTFYMPVAALPDSLREAVASGYLCMRAIDEVEDHPQLDRSAKAEILRGISRILQAQGSIESLRRAGLETVFAPYHDQLAEV
ncbi:MAG TPA: squalene/phytoene synthase family protein, partial [Anaerolineales bacterium]|nr:squalene/phytoene synthase family protein [Anaerolineales bacterium]